MNNTPSIRLRRPWLSPAAVAAVGACAVLMLGGAAKADPIDYIFTGTGTGILGGTGGNNSSGGVPFVADTGGTAFSGAFTVTLTADTTTATGSVAAGFSNDAITATFTAGALTATFTLASDVSETTSGGIIIFGETVPAPVYFVAEGLSNSTFDTYDLATALSSTSGSVSFLPQIFTTSAGDLEFDSISSLSFEAVLPTSVPEPSAIAIFGTGLVGLLGAFGLRRRHPRA